MGRESLYKFLDFPFDCSGSLSMLKAYFLEYDPEEWRRGSGGGYMQCKVAEILYCLVVAEDPRFGILLNYSSRGLAGDPHRQSFYSVGNTQLMSIFEESPDEMIMPVGAYIAPAAAWKVVLEFDARPEARPASVPWIESSAIPWPPM